MFMRRHKKIDIVCPAVNLADDQRTKMLLSQITYLHSEQVSIQNSFLAMLYIPLAFVGVMVYYAYTSPASEKLFLLLPFLFSWCIFNLMKYTMKALGIDAYIRHLERELNAWIGENLFCWQDQLVYANGYSIWGILGQVPCLVAVYAFLIYKFFEVLTNSTSSLNPTISCFITLVFLIQAALLITMAVFTARHYHKVLKKVTNIRPVKSKQDSNESN